MQSSRRLHAIRTAAFAAAAGLLLAAAPTAAHAAEPIPVLHDWWAVCSPDNPSVHAYVGITSTGGEATTRLQANLLPPGANTPIYLDEEVPYPQDYDIFFPATVGPGTYWLTFTSFPGAENIPVRIPEDCYTPFVDVPIDYVFIDQIIWMSDSGISTGWDRGDGTFAYDPWGDVKRDAMAAFLYRFAGSPVYTAPAVSPFADVTPSSPFYKEIAWLAEQGITTGWDVGGRTEYRPYSPITRDAMAAFLYRFAGEPAYEPPTASAFADVSMSGSFFTEISWLADQGITTGWNVGGRTEFRPFINIKRDAMAAFLYRFSATMEE